MTVRRHVVATARRLHLEPQLRRAQRALSYERRRDWEDNRGIERLLAETLTPTACCIDVGASQGDILRHIVRYAPEGAHLAFEPLPELAEALAAAFPRVDVRACALYDAAGTLPFHRVVRSHWHSSLSPMGRSARGLETFPVAVRRLDDELPPGYAPALIKIDVEGAEGAVLAGAELTLRRHRPIVVFEHCVHAAHFARGTADVFATLGRAGLRIFDIDGGGPYDLAGFEAQVRSGRLWTFVARP
jgi:FkbM family methyltransferase